MVFRVQGLGFTLNPKPETSVRPSLKAHRGAECHLVRPILLHVHHHGGAGGQTGGVVARDVAEQTRVRAVVVQVELESKT